MAILYVETSLPMSIAMGRDPDALALVQSFAPAHVLALPAVCIMEALSAFQRERSQHNDFTDRLRARGVQLARDRMSPAAAAMLSHLEQARAEHERLLNEVQNRLVSALDELNQRALLIPVTPSVVQDALRTQHLRQMSDNLILHTILTHAAGPTDPKALLTGNTNDFAAPDVRGLLAAVGVETLCSTAAEASRWLTGLA